jgi:hypothetical protein
MLFIPLEKTQRALHNDEIHEVMDQASVEADAFFKHFTNKTPPDVLV